MAMNSGQIREKYGITKYNDKSSKNRKILAMARQADLERAKSATDKKSVKQRNAELNAAKKQRMSEWGAKTYKTGKYAGQTYGTVERARTARRKASGYTNF